MKILVKAYPNGEVNASVAKKSPLESPSVPRHDPESVRIIKATVSSAGIKNTIAMIAEGKIFGVNPEPLCLSTVAILRKRKGAGGLSRHGKRMIECGTTLIEQHCRRDCLSFLTLTYPQTAITTQNEKSFANAKNRFTNWLIRRLRAAGLPDLYSGCIEAHPNRSRVAGFPVPHYHICYQGRLPGRAWNLSPDAIKRAWYQILVNEGLCPEGGDWSACANVQRVKKSVSRYMSKYLTKNHSSIKKEINEDSPKTHPGSWHLISRSLLKLIKQSTKHRSGIEAETILDFLSIPGNPWVLYQGNIEITAENGSKYWVGSYAKVTQECLRCL